MERNYEFRKRIDIVHVPNRRDWSIYPKRNEIIIKNGWELAVSKDCSDIVYNVARDLQDYLLVSMGVSVILVKVEDIKSYLRIAENTIVLTEKNEVPELGKKLNVCRSYRLIVEKNRIIICGNNAKGTGQGSYYLEDLMNLKEAPILEVCDVIREPLFQPRMVHSGWGIDQYPDSHLNTIAHAGFDSILLFTTGLNSTVGSRKIKGILPGDIERNGRNYRDFNDIIYRAAKYGLDVYIYSMLESEMHPDNPMAEEYYENSYGKIFKECPGLKGVTLVGEAVGFPSKDSNTAMISRKQKERLGIKVNKPLPGWWPCKDFPQWLNLIKKIIRKYNPTADIVFWTYNWGYAPEKDRIELIENLPDDITLQATFEMFEDIIDEKGLYKRCVDYTLSFEGPGKYFISEAKAASKRGLKLYTMSNTAGLTWDIGVIPYEPFPYQWIKRYEGLKMSRSEWGLSGLMENHHYGWWPSFISELSKWSFWDPSPSSEEILRKIACRDFSKTVTHQVLKAWKYWSEGIRYYVPTNYDQYGPFRVGPSYPLIFENVVDIPAEWYAMFGNTICYTDYNPNWSHRSDLNKENLLKKEIQSLETMKSFMEKGIACLEEAMKLVPENKQKTGIEMLRLVKFICICI